MAALAGEPVGPRLPSAPPGRLEQQRRALQLGDELLAVGEHRAEEVDRGVHPGDGGEVGAGQLPAALLGGVLEPLPVNGWRVRAGEHLQRDRCHPGGLRADGDEAVEEDRVGVPSLGRGEDDGA
jgi:hypothetical protein